MNATCLPVCVDQCAANPAASLAVRAVRLAEALEEDIRQFLVASDQTVGDIEVQIEQQSRELKRAAAEKAAQQKADLTPPTCPVCHTGSIPARAFGWITGAGRREDDR